MTHATESTGMPAWQATRRQALGSLTGALACGLAPVTQASSADVEAFYKGRTITLLVATSPGGSTSLIRGIPAPHSTPSASIPNASAPGQYTNRDVDTATRACA